MAFDFAKNCWQVYAYFLCSDNPNLQLHFFLQNAVVFAFEFGSEGKRKYLVTTYHHFSQHYLLVSTHQYTHTHTHTHTHSLDYLL